MPSTAIQTCHLISDRIPLKSSLLTQLALYSLYVTIRFPSVRPSVRLSVCPIFQPLQQRAAGLLLGVRRAGDIDRLLHGAPAAGCQQQRRAVSISQKSEHRLLYVTIVGYTNSSNGIELGYGGCCIGWLWNGNFKVCELNITSDTVVIIKVQYYDYQSVDLVACKHAIHFANANKQHTKFPLFITILIYFWLFKLSEKKTNCNLLAHPTWKCRHTDLWNGKLFRLTEGMLCSFNVDGSEKSQLWVGMCGSEKPVLICGNWNVRQAMSQQVFRVTTFYIYTCL